MKRIAEQFPQLECPPRIHIKASNTNEQQPLNPISRIERPLNQLDIRFKESIPGTREILINALYAAEATLQNLTITKPCSPDSLSDQSNSGIKHVD